MALPGHGNLSGLPPAHIVVAELDDLRASGELLQRQIDEAGGQTTLYLAAGMVHGHLNRSPSLPETNRTLDHLATVLNSLGR